MKKIIAIILALTCAFALFSCNGDQPEAPVYTEEAAEFITAINSTSVTELDVTVTVDTEVGTLTSTYKTVYNTDNSSTMTYRIENIAGIDSAENTVVTEGTVTCDASGNYSDGGSVSGKLGAQGVTFDADSDKITNFKIDGNVLTINVAAADTASVIGNAIESDAVIVVTIAEGKVVSISLSYTDVSIVCNYK